MEPKEPIRILLVGNGGREHALAWKLSQSPLVESIIAVPGNGGTSTCTKVTNNDSVKADDYPGLVALAQKHNVNLVIPGPEAPLVDGIDGYFRAVGIRCYGPSKLAARMEGSKTFSKEFMKRNNIPTAAFENFSNYEDAKKYLDSVDHNVVLKASGLAAGKGVILPQTKEEAQQALKSIMLDKEFGNAGNEIVIEEFLEGDELSILSFCDGYTIRSLPPAQDHKRINDGDEGPNTGGMGCYAPTRIADEKTIAEIQKKILQPTIDGMRRERFPFVGTLFTGLMMTKDGPKCLEYNVRFGDPETQTLLPLMSKDSDLAEIMIACTEGWLDQLSVKIDDKFSATVVVSSGGYPGSYAKGTPMTVRSPPIHTNHFHAGTIIKDGQLQTAGGRVIAAQAISETLKDAVSRAYAGVACIKFDGMHYRNDIAYRAFKDTPKTPESMTYASAGVSVDGGNQFVERIKNAVLSTAQPGAPAKIGGFAGEIDLSFHFPGAPVISIGIDGVGTKLDVANKMNKHNTVGIDLVAMNVNDLLCDGARPLGFVDYIGCSRLNQKIAAEFVEGVAKGCIDSGCALLGGETAEMPGMYTGEDYDAAGAAFGARFSYEKLPKLDLMIEGDVILGLASNGVHSNGFSLVRKIVDKTGLEYAETAPWDDTTTVGLSLLTPTRLYVKSIVPLLSRNVLKGLVHITGGGFTENIPRALPHSLAAEVNLDAWQSPAVFKWLQKAGNVASPEMAKTFNNGIGMVAIVSKEDANQVKSELEASGETVYKIGTLIPRADSEKGCVLKNLTTWDKNRPQSGDQGVTYGAGGV